MTARNILVGVPYYVGQRYFTDGACTGAFTSRQFSTDKQLGFDDPDYKRKIQARVDATLPYTRIVNKLKIPCLWHEVYQRRAPYSTIYVETRPVTTLTPKTSIPVNSQTADAGDRVLAKIKRKLAEDTNQFKSLIPLAEIKETRGLIRSTAETTATLLKAVIGLKHGKVRDLFKAVSHAWLQWSFAIAPTISDTQALASSISSYLLKSDFTATHAEGFTTRWCERYPQNSPAAAELFCGQWFNTDRMLTHSYRVKYTVGTYYDLVSGNNYDAFDQFGFRIPELVPMLWEWLIFSWVVDYFTTTGSWLSDTFTAPAGSTLYLVKSEKYTCLDEHRFRFVFTDFYGDYKKYYRYMPNAFASCESTVFVRSIPAGGQLPHRALRLKSCDEIAVNSVNRVLNLASLLVGKGKPKNLHL